MITLTVAITKFTTVVSEASNSIKEFVKEVNLTFIGNEVNIKNAWRESSD